VIAICDFLRFNFSSNYRCLRSNYFAVTGLLILGAKGYFVARLSFGGLFFLRSWSFYMRLGMLARP
jgi:hypothetical protein